MDFLGAHTHHLTYAENLGAPDCLVPTTSYGYRPIRLGLDRDLGKAAEIMEIDGDCPAEIGQEVEEIIWRRMNVDDRLRRERIGVFTDGATERRSESLALA